MNPYGVNVSGNNLVRPLAILQVLYNSLPETRGCENCEETNGKDNLHYCCKENTPSMYYAEFLRVWKKVQNTWSKKRKLDLFIRAITNYLSTELQKGCIFYNKGCTCYEDRPLTCRNYGVISQESWDKRVSSIKKREGEDFYIKPQCNLVSTIDGKAVTEKQEEKWFERTTDAEKALGIKKQYIDLHDIPGGSYRMFHDHLLLEVLEVPAMNKLTEIKMTKPSKEDIESFAVTLGDMMKDKM